MKVQSKRRLPWYIIAGMVAMFGLTAWDFVDLFWGRSNELHVVRGATMGTFYTVKLAAPTSESSWPPPEQELKHRFDERLAEINRLISTYEPESEISRFNRHTGDDWFEVSPETAQLVAAALAVAERSQGAYDPTIGPLVDLWGFGPKKGRVEPPSDEQIAEAQTLVGFRYIAVQLDPPALKKTLPGVQLDLSGIGKGYAVDELVSLLTALGYDNVAVIVGGEVRGLIAKEVDDYWKIGIERPDSNSTEFWTQVYLENEAISTSGDTHNHFEHKGRRYSHIIDATTGRTAKHNTASVSIIATTSAEADALATALMVMGEKRGVAWAKQHDIAALFLIRDGQEISERATPAFQDHLTRMQR